MIAKGRYGGLIEYDFAVDLDVYSITLDQFREHINGINERIARLENGMSPEQAVNEPKTKGGKFIRRKPVWSLSTNTSSRMTHART